MDAARARIDCRKKYQILLSPRERGTHLVPGWQFTRRLVQMKIVETAEMAPTCHAGYKLVETAEVAPTCHNFSLVETTEVAPTCH
jgi:hypothetical protein